MKLPQVHIAVNVSGLLTVLGSAASFIVANPNAPTALGLPTKDVTAILTIAGVLAAFLPTKRGVASNDATKTAIGNLNNTP